MRKSILAALIAATTLSSVAASAQEWNGRGRSRDAEGQVREPRPDGPRPDRENFRQQRAERQQARPAPQPVQAAQRPDGGDRRGWRGDGGQRPQWNAGQRRGMTPGDAQARQQFRQERRDDRQDFRQERGEDRRAFNQGRVTPEQFRQDRRDDRRDFRRDRQDDRRDWRSDRGPDRNFDRNRWNGASDWNRGNDWSRRDWSRGNDWGRSGNRWDRGWRNDNRYDWQDWRVRNRSAYRLPRYYPPRGYSYGYQRFGVGITLGSILFAQNYWIDDPWSYRLPPAYGPYRWVRYYNDALLVDIDSGEVVDVIYDIFW